MVGFVVRIMLMLLFEVVCDVWGVYVLVVLYDVVCDCCVCIVYCGVMVLLI